MANDYEVKNITNLGQLKKLATRTKNELDGVKGRVTTIENAGYIPESTIDEKISAAVAGALIPGGSVLFANLPALAKANNNHIYNIEDAFTTTADFLEGAGKEFPAGTQVAIVNTGTASAPVYKYDTYTGTVDYSVFMRKKTSAVNGNFAIFDAAGDAVDSGTKPSDYLTAHQDISGKADKDTDAVANNIAKFDANGNPVDAGYALATDADVDAMLTEVFGA